MRILFVAPHPFYSERGTPIAVRMMLEALSEAGHDLTLLTYHEGQDIHIDRVTLVRANPPWRVSDVPIGPSWKKIVCDLGLTRTFLRLVKQGSFDLVHAVEEAAYVAYLLRKRHGLPYIVDMDSSIPLQIGEKFGWSRPFLPPVNLLERGTIRHAAGVTAVCQSLLDRALSASPSGPAHVIEDVAMLEPESEADQSREGLRETLGIKTDSSVVLYVGNLEAYQGIDLLLDAFERTPETATLLVVGGAQEDIDRYLVKCRNLGIEKRVHWLGPRPLGELGWHLRQADILVSPRTKGDNTPMKIYSYLASGVPIVATDIESHTQVLTPEVSVLAAATAKSFADGINRLIGNPEHRCSMAANASRLVEERYSREAFRQKVRNFYEAVVAHLDTKG